MNIISTEKNKSFYIGDKIEIVVLRIYPSGLVKLGIKAPKNVPIHREEFLEALKKLKIQLNAIKK